MNKKPFYIIFLLSIFLVFSACGDMDVILDIELVEPPDKLDYIVNSDSAISLEGGKIRLITGHETIFGIIENEKNFSDALEDYMKSFGGDIK